MLSKFKVLWSREDGQAMTEYGVILGIIAIALFSALLALRVPLVSWYEAVGDRLIQAAGTQ